MKLAEELKNSVKRFKKLCPNEKGDPPEKYICGKCGLRTGWFWLNSDCEDLFPSQWMKHLCICEIIKNISDMLNVALNQQETAKRLAESNSGSKRYNQQDVNCFYATVEKLKEYIKQKTGLLKDLNALKKMTDSNAEYYKKRVELARKYEAWWELFECNSERETQKLLRDLYSTGSDKFIIDLENIKLEFMEAKT